MRHSVKQYASALVAAVKGKSDSEQREAIRRFITLLRKRGLWSRRMLMLKEAERQYLKEAGAVKVSLASAAPLAPETRREIERVLGKNILWQERTDPGILAGIKILVNEELLIDATAKRQIERMFN